MEKKQFVVQVEKTKRTKKRIVFCVRIKKK